MYAIYVINDVYEIYHVIFRYMTILVSKKAYGPRGLQPTIPNHLYRNILWGKKWQIPLTYISLCIFHMQFRNSKRWRKKCIIIPWIMTYILDHILVNFLVNQDTLLGFILCTLSYSAFGHTLNLVTLCIWTHSVFGHILYLDTFCIWSHSVFGHILEDTIIH